MKYSWRYFLAATKETIHAQLAALSFNYGIRFKVNFS
jgi:hypothetical protein